LQDTRLQGQCSKSRGKTMKQVARRSGAADVATASA
jgi:hypothetical protein